METKTMDPWKVKEHPDNPRRRLKRGSKAYEGIKDSLVEFGLVETLVWNKRSVGQKWKKGEEGVLVGGHQRLTAIRDLGWPEVTVTVVDLNEDQELALLVALNKHGGEWDTKTLGEVLDRVLDSTVAVGLTGFDGSELDKLRAESMFHDPEIEFTDELLEEHNYVVLYFDNTVDWETAREVFGLKTVKALDSRPGYERKGIGRVIKGSPVVRRLLG